MFTVSSSRLRVALVFRAANTVNDGIVCDRVWKPSFFTKEFPFTICRNYFCPIQVIMSRFFTNILWILFANVFFWPEEMLKFYFCIIPSEIRKIEENFDIWHRNFFVADVKSYFCVHFGPEPCDTNRVDQLYISWFSKQLFILSSIWFGIHFAFFHQTFLWKEKFRSIDYSHTSIAEN